MAILSICSTYPPEDFLALAAIDHPQMQQNYMPNAQPPISCCQAGHRCFGSHSDTAENMQNVSCSVGFKRNERSDAPFCFQLILFS